MVLKEALQLARYSVYNLIVIFLKRCMAVVFLRQYKT